jgi:hypothetical protein
MFANNRYLAMSYLLFFGLVTYILSSWWIWYYGGSFSLRAYIEYFGVFAVLLTLLLNQLRFQHFYLGLVILLIMLCQIQTYQYRYFIIHWSEMDATKYLASLKHIFS